MNLDFKDFREWKSTIFFLAVSAFSGYLFFSDFRVFTRDLQLTKSKPIARLVKSYNQVRHRKGDIPIWNSGHLGDGLRNGDFIYTGSASIAEIDFIEERSKIVVGEYSLVKIETLDDGLHIDLSKGSITLEIIEPGSRVRIRYEERTLMVSGRKGRITVKTQEGGKLALTHSDGALDIKEVLVGRNSSPNSTLIKALNSPRLLRPIVEDRFSAGDPVDFKWIQQNPDNFTELEFSQDPSFKRPTLRKLVDSQSTSQPFWRKGVFFWRARQISRAGQKSEYSTHQSFEIYSRKPKIIHPDSTKLSPPLIPLEIELVN